MEAHVLKLVSQFRCGSCGLVIGGCLVAAVQGYLLIPVPQPQHLPSQCIDLNVFKRSFHADTVCNFVFAPLDM